MRKFGKRQKEVVNRLNNGCFIVEQEDFILLRTDYWLEDSDGNIYKTVPRNMITSFLNRGILYRTEKYSSTKIQINNLVLKN